MSASILVVEDSDTVRQILQIHLRNAGYEVRAAEDAITAGHMILAKAPDLIITDLNMPHMDGYELTAAVKSDPATAHIPVVFLSSEQNGGFRAKELGAAGYLTKPVRADRLLALVQESLPPGK